MVNYMKSEFYRILHGKTIYLLTLVITGFAVFLNVVLYAFMTWTPDFPYGYVRFALIQMIAGIDVFYIGALLVVMLLSGDEYKNGVLKNAIAGGMSRSRIFIGKCIVYGIVAAASAAVILAVFISTAYGLLEWNPAVPLDSTEPLRVLLIGAAANLPFSLASIVLTVALSLIFKKETQVYIGWAFVVYLIPTAFQLLGFRNLLCARIAQWMPVIFLRTQINVTFSSMQMDVPWMYPEGFWKLIAAGVIGIILFGAAGILGFRRKDIS